MFEKLRNNSKIIIYIACIALITTLGISSYLFMGDSGGDRGQAPVDRQNIAVVNDSPIPIELYRRSLQLRAPQLGNVMAAERIDAQYDVLEELIEAELLVQEAERRNIEVQITEDDIDEAIDEILENNEMTEEEFEQLVAEQGLSFTEYRNEIREELRLQKKRQRVWEEEMESVTVSEDEIEQEYEQMAEEDEEIDEYEEMKEDIETRLLQEKRNQHLFTWMENLKNSAEIEIHDPVMDGYRSYRDGNYEEAIEVFASMLGQNDTPAIYDMLARSYLENDDVDSAIRIYNQAIEQNEYSFDLHFNLAGLYISEEQEEEAMEKLDVASELAPHDARAHYQLFMLYSELGADEKAAEHEELFEEIQAELEEEQEGVPETEPVEIDPEDGEEIEISPEDLEPGEDGEVEIDLGE